MTKLSKIRIKDNPIVDDWTSEAACAGKPVEWFYPDRGDTTVKAKKVCRECPVKAECLEYGLSQAHGVWGGVSVRGRRKIVRERRRRAERET